MYNEKDFQTALVCGLMAKGRDLKGERTPLAYLYNGVQLPMLPEVEGYAVIYESGKSYALEIYENITYDYYQGTDSKWWSVYSVGQYWWYDYDSTTNSWVLYETNRTEEPEYMFGVKKHSRLWSNFDISDESGAVYFEASEPVPVYE